MEKTICAFQVPEVATMNLPGFVIAARPDARRELITSIRTLEVALLVLDLDQPAAVDTLVQCLEVCPQLGVVGITATKDLDVVLAAQRAGCKQIVQKPIDADDLVLALRRAVNEPVAVKARGRIVAVIGASGGVGATTVACHLAVELAAVSKTKVGLFDLDFDFGTAALALNVKPQFTVGDMASAGHVDPFLLEKAAVDTPFGVHLFARPESIAEGHGIHEESIRQILRTAAMVYGSVIIDLPHRLDALTGAAIETCDHLLVVTQLTVPSICNARRLLETLQSEGVSRDSLDYVLNRYRKNQTTCTPEHAEMELRKPAFAMIPSDFRSVHMAIDAGEPINARNPVRAAIHEMAGKLVGEPTPAPRPGGWLRSLRIGGKPSKPS